MTRRVRRETFRAAVFFWIIPFAAALLIAAVASLNAVFEASIFLFATSKLTFLEMVFNILLTARFLNVLFSVCLALFIADLVLLGAAFAGNRLSSLIIIMQPQPFGCDF